MAINNLTRLKYTSVNNLSKIAVLWHNKRHLFSCGQYVCTCVIDSDLYVCAQEMSTSLLLLKVATNWSSSLSTSTLSWILILELMEPTLDRRGSLPPPLPPLETERGLASAVGRAQEEGEEESNDTALAT